METIKNKLEKIENAPPVMAIKGGLIMIIPVLLLGFAALVFEYFPIIQYQRFVEEVLQGKLLLFFNSIYDATFGMLSVYLTCAISFCYTRERRDEVASLAVPITSLICFLISSNFRVSDFPLDALGVKGVFIAILSSLIATQLFRKISQHTEKRKRGYAEDTDIEFNHSVSVILPAGAVIAVFAVMNIIITELFHVDSIFALFVNAANSLFMTFGRSFASGFLMVLVSSTLWFFGIHGSNVLEAVMEKLFTPAIGINAALVAAGGAPTEIFTKQFFDIFILMGGCGTAICLLLSILLFSKRQRSRRISRLAMVPMLFNINELLVFGYPVIYNTSLMLPFILTPLFCFVTSYLSMRIGIVPLTVSEVNWTAPVLLNGYMATRSFAGSALQLFNIVAGVFIYRPFIKAYDRKCEAAELAMVGELADFKRDSERTLEPIALTKLRNTHGSLARSMAAELRLAVEKGELLLFYQPQYDDRGSCIGAEALLRWNHPLYGMIYPPLIIQLARETNILIELEKYMLLHAIEDGEKLKKETGYDKEISVNISSATLRTEEYLSLLKRLVDEGRVAGLNICLEITEQTAMVPDKATFDHLKMIKELGYLLAIDDFSMGHTSLTYLQENFFDTVKLDGALIRDMMSNPRSYDIIKTITGLAQKLGFNVTAEYVENQEQVEMLKAAGCFQYQGYLYSPAVDYDAFARRYKEEKQSACH